MRATIEGQLASQLDGTLVRELLDAHAEAKRNFYLGGLRLSAVEGGRFCEAAFRLLEYITKGKVFTPLGKPLDTDKLINQLGSMHPSLANDSIRLHIPRSLRLVYDIRNKRDAAHLADGIDPNFQDATVVVAVIDWVLAELIRLYHNVDANAASNLVDGIVKKAAPIVQDFNGFLKILNPELQASDHCMVLLYQKGNDGVSEVELSQWVRPKMRTNLKRTLAVLVHKKDLVHFDGSRYIITRAGELHVEQKNLITPAQLSK